MAPYRTVGREERVEAPRDPGIVGEVIAQFADRFAFLRELVQNAIDAGTPSVEVRLTHDEATQVMRVAVRDQGEGMDRAIVEQQLLVLFRSTKEKDDRKIGKFGIGFASVLSPGPRIVVVQTVRGGQRLTLHLHPDLTYQLFDAGAGERAGTIVELELEMGGTEAADFARRSKQALERWCRHAAVPISFTAEGEPGPRAVRIDRPLALDGALAEVRGTADEGQLTAVVGLAPAGAPPYAGFFNHGLMLHESAAPLLGGLAMKVQDPRLGHTLSRDDVRRDARFARAMAFAEELAAKLPAQVAIELATAAAAQPRTRYRQLVAAIDAAGLALGDAAWWFPLVEPLVEPLADRWSVSAVELTSARGALRRVWGSAARSPLTALLARAGVPVLELSGGADGGRDQMVTRVQLCAGCEVVDLASELILVEPLVAEEHEVALLAELRDALEAVHRAPSQIVLARLSAGRALAAVAAHTSAVNLASDATAAGRGDGEISGPPAIAGGPRDAVHVSEPRAVDGVEHPPAYALDREVARRSPFALLRAPALVLSAEHPLVRAARRGDPRMAASHLARALLLHYRLLTAERSAKLCTFTLGRLGLVLGGAG